MPTQFKRPSDPVRDRGATLFAYQSEPTPTPFNPDDVLHIQLVDDCTSDVKVKLKALQDIDKKMTIGFTIGISSLGLSWLFPVLGIVATAGLAYGAYQLGKRQQAYIEYEAALENLARCCIWTLGEVPATEAKDHHIEGNTAVQGMIQTLAPLTNAQQLRDFIDDKIEDGVVEEAQKMKQETTVFDMHLDKKKEELYFNIYGYKQGGFLAILKGIGYAIQNAFSSAKAAFTSKEPEAAAEPQNKAEPTAN
jgi:hypothetical protein